jgi:predicted DNA-binding transcriptional regulator YafY
LKIVLFDGFWYLLAFGDKRALLKLRLEKIISAKPSGKYFKKSQNICKMLDESVSMWIENKRNIKAQLPISECVAKYLKSKNFFGTYSS